MKQPYRKLSACRGETIAEVLVAILVAGLSVALLAGMITAATRLNATARKADAALYSELAAAEGRTKILEETGSAQLTLDGDTYHIPVTVYGVQDGLTAYGKAVGP